MPDLNRTAPPATAPDNDPAIADAGRLRVLIDGYFLGKPYGFGRFSFELCRALGRSDGGIAVSVAVPSRVDVATLPVYPGVSWHVMRDANFAVWEQIMIPRLARRLACDVIHFPFNTRAAFTYGIPTVTTVHDLIFMDQSLKLSAGKDFAVQHYAKLVFRLCTARSRSVVSVSNTTRRALRRYKVEARTVYNTVDGFVAEHRPDAVERAGRPYLLHRGGTLEHRNTERVIAAFRAARPALQGVDLKVIGAPDGARLWNVGDVPCIHFLPRVTDRELASLYAGSAAVVATSLQEGFGLPIIEGFGFGAPVITSNVDPMKEVAGDAALLVDPYDVSAIGGAMTAVVADAALAQSLRVRGAARMDVFASRRVAEQMLAMYRSAALEGRKRPAPVPAAARRPGGQRLQQRS